MERQTQMDVEVREVKSREQSDEDDDEGQFEEQQNR